MTQLEKQYALSVTIKDESPPPLNESATKAIEHFLVTLGDEPCSDLYSLVINQVEGPLLRAAMEHTRQNQSHAAAILGINRGTLRKKLKQYGMLSRDRASKSKERLYSTKKSSNLLG